MSDDSLKEKTGRDKKQKENRFCPSCKRQLPPYVIRCPVCGTETITETETEPPKKEESKYLSMVTRLTYASGFVSFLGAIANFAVAAMVSLKVAVMLDIPSDVRQYSNNLVLMFFATSLLCLIGGGLGWDVAMNPWRKGSVRKTVELGLTFIIGSLNVIEGIIINEQTGLTPFLIWIIGFPTLVFSLLILLLSLFD